MSDSSSSRCPQCCAAMPNATEGLCPRCLMAQIVQPTQGDGPGVATIPPLTPEELAPHFPQLEIIACLGRGGMGVVYQARQKSLNRLVALKLLAPERADDPQFAARFEKEAQALAALNHPNIVGVFDFGRVESTGAGSSPSSLRSPLYYLLMEFVDGVNLRQLLHTKRLTPKEALGIVPPVCEALQCAHDHGIVHRDIKPENLLIDKAGRVKIADFGVAKIVERDFHLVSETPDAPDSKVRATLPFGTPDYAAPEQLSGDADHRADIYSLGVVLYEMLTGERPQSKVEPPSKRVQMDVRIDEIVLRALEKKPELRFATAAEFRTQIEGVVQTPQPAVTDLSKFSDDPRHWRLYFVYFCREDPRLVVPKRIAGLGWTLNFARPMAFPLLLAMGAAAWFIYRILYWKGVSRDTASWIFVALLLGFAALLHKLSNPKRTLAQVQPAAAANPWPRRMFWLLAALLLVPALVLFGLLIPVYQGVRATAAETRRGNQAKQHEVEKVKTADENGVSLDTHSNDTWIVVGRVVDDANRPVPEASIQVSTGTGSLHVTGEGKTGADGRYRVTFGPGFSMAAKDRAGSLQAAFVHVGKSGYAEQNLCEPGKLQMTWELTKKQLAGGWRPGPEKTFLPGKPLTVDFVLVRAAQIEGTLIDKSGKPIPNREIVMTNDRIGPDGGIHGTTRTDLLGRFTFKDVSTQHAWSFSIDNTPGHPSRTRPDRFAAPEVHRITLTADGGPFLSTVRRSDAEARISMAPAHAFEMRWVTEAPISETETETLEMQGATKAGQPAERLHVEKAALLNETDVQLVGVIASEASDQPGAIRIGLTLTQEGAQKFAQITAAGRGRRLAILLSGRLHAAPVIREAIAGGVLEISGSFTEAEAKELADAIRAAIPSATPSTSLQGTMNDADLQKLSWQEFDQTERKYWRELADVRRFKEAAELIERMLALHPEIERVNAASLHFHAGQCWAMAGENEHALNQLKLAQHPSGTTTGLRWNVYVDGTAAFLKGDKRELLNAHESLAQGDPVNLLNLRVLDRLLANFGKSYAEAYETDGQDHRKLSADCFNRAWELLEKKDRTTEDDERILSLSHASLAHWRMREDCTDRHLSIGYWQLSRVYATLGQGTNAERYGGLCLNVSGKEPPFYLAYAHEALARAALLNGRKELFERHLNEAEALAAQVTDADEKKLLEGDLAQLVWMP